MKTQRAPGGARLGLNSGTDLKILLRALISFQSFRVFPIY